MPGDEAWRDDDEIKNPQSPKERLDGEDLAFKIPEYLAELRGTSQDGDRPSLGPRPSNIPGIQVAGSHRRSTFVRAVEAVTGLGATLLAPSIEKMTNKYVTTAAKKNSTVIVPINAKQWLLQSLRMKDWELQELFDQVSSVHATTTVLNGFLSSVTCYECACFHHRLLKTLRLKLFGLIKITMMQTLCLILVYTYIDGDDSPTRSRSCEGSEG